MRIPCDCEIWQVCPKCVTPEEYARHVVENERLLANASATADSRSCGVNSESSAALRAQEKEAK